MDGLNLPLTLYDPTKYIFRSSAIINRLPWDGSDIGNIMNIATVVPRRCVDILIYFSYPDNEGDYAILERYTQQKYKLELIKQALDIPTRPFHIVTHKKQQYFAFKCNPYDYKVMLTKLKKSDINDKIRKFFMFRILFGVNFSIFYSKDLNDYVIAKHGNLVNFNLKLQKKYFQTAQQVRDTANFFKDRIDRLEDVIADSIWEFRISNRLNDYLNY